MKILYVTHCKYSGAALTAVFKILVIFAKCNFKFQPTDTISHSKIFIYVKIMKNVNTMQLDFVASKLS